MRIAELDDSRQERIESAARPEKVRRDKKLRGDSLYLLLTGNLARLINVAISSIDDRDNGPTTAGIRARDYTYRPRHAVCFSPSLLREEKKKGETVNRVQRA